MPDLNKAIAGLEHCRKYGSLGGNDCSGHYEWTDWKDEMDITRLEEHRHDCPYGKCKTGCVVTLVEDATELLKEYRGAKPLIDAISDQMHEAASMFRRTSKDELA